MNEKFNWIKKIEKAYLFIVILLPLAAVFMRLGTTTEYSYLSSYGQTIYEHLPLLYAMMIAYGFSKDHSSIVVFASALGYILFETGYQSVSESNDLYILGGIVTGLTCALLYNRFRNYDFSGGFEILNQNRHIPLFSSIMLFIMGRVVGYVWPIINLLFTALGHWITQSGTIGTFVYGVMNRLLLPFGLHHNLNSYLWYHYGTYGGVSGDLNRFYAGDPTSGTYMAGFYIIMMFGLPAIIYAFYRNISKGNRHVVRGLYVVSAVISLFTGITEPIELMFMFTLPGLYALHAVFTGFALAVSDALNINMGFKFSAGLIDFIGYTSKSGAYYLIGLGVLFAYLYYKFFDFIIKRKNYMVPGDYIENENYQLGLAHNFIKDLILAFGGVSNIVYVHFRYTRFEFKIKDESALDYNLLDTMNIVNVFCVKENTYQVITGNQGKYLGVAIKEVLEDKLI
jgi:PTS system N-acetylglucosamine-specific IIC component